MLRFIRRLSLFLLIPLPFLYGLQYVVDSGLRKSNGAMFAEWNDIYSGRINTDTIVMGSSRAWVHYDPRILDAYNLGIDGFPFPMQKARFDIYLKHNPKPKVVIQNMDAFILAKRKDLYNHGQFLPYLYDPDVWKATDGHQGAFSWPQMYFPMFKYNNQFGLVWQGIWSFLGFTETPVKYRGYQGQDKVWDDSFEQFRQANPKGVIYEIDPYVEQQFREYLQFCRDNGIKVYLVFSPEYVGAQRLGLNRADVITRYRQLADETGAIFINYSDHHLSFDTKYFYNSQHLNKTGAELFSTDLANRILAQ
jgi:hypothetical protein